MSTFDDAVAALYQGEPADFVAHRKRLADEAKAVGDKALATRILALRRPSAAAAVVNHLGDALDDVFAAGAALRAAQTRLDGVALGRLSAERQKAIDAIMRTVTGSASVKEQVRATLLAASTDPAAAEAVASGALVTPLSYAGWGEVDLGDALAHREAAAHGRAALRLVGEGRTSAPASAPHTAAEPAAFEDDELARDDDESARAAAEAAQAEARERAEREQARRLERDRRAARRRVEQATRRLAAAEDAYRAASAARVAARAGLAAANADLAALD